MTNLKIKINKYAKNARWKDAKFVKVITNATDVMKKINISKTNKEHVTKMTVYLHVPHACLIISPYVLNVMIITYYINNHAYGNALKDILMTMIIIYVNLAKKVV